MDIKTTFSGIKEQRVALVVEIERIEKKLATAQERLTQRKKELTTAQEQLIQYDKEVLDGLKELGIQVPTTIE
ncbi:hypothetical protein IIC44_02695 [Patescibacteria group bacterium]|nr:hypothetical protein [Patescibacteria group bacterium]